MEKKRVVAYIDGFNLYHSIDQFLGDNYKWVDYRKMVEIYLGPDDYLVDIYLFTAEPSWNKEKLKRHRLFMTVMAKKCKIKIVKGNYSCVTRNFNGSKMPVIDRLSRQKLNIIVDPNSFSFETFEEKQTDVNLSLYIAGGAFLDKYDKALIFSGDSDIAPAILMAKQHFPQKKFTAILPINGKGHVIARACDKTKNLSNVVLGECIMDDQMTIEGEIFSSPYKTNIPLSGDIQGGGQLTGCEYNIS